MRLAAAWLVLAALAHPGCGYAQTPADARPRPPCAGAAPSPSYAKPGSPPSVLAWGKEAGPWTPPACLGWSRARFRLVIALAASFEDPGDPEALLARFGAVSTLRGTRYWSVTDQEWDVLVTDAGALAGPGAREHRADFTAAEMTVATDLYFEQRDNRSSEAVRYRMRVLEAGKDRLVVETENASPVRAFHLTLFPPGSLRAVYFLERHAPGTWSFYGLSAVTGEASALAGVSEPSYINRAAALYRHFIGVPGDRDPPLAR